MCGIAGVVARDSDRRLDPALIDEMVAKLHHRGPDDTGVVTLPGVSLGLKRLSIIDVAGGRQPIQNEDRTITFVGNGEIFNYRVLRDQLVAKGHRFRTGSDMEVIVHGYEEWGDRVAEHVAHRSSPDAAPAVPGRGCRHCHLLQDCSEGAAHVASVALGSNRAS